MKHTQGPWRAGEHLRETSIWAGDRKVCVLCEPKPHVVSVSENEVWPNAEFIVKACNNFDALVEALEYFEDCMDRGVSAESIRYAEKVGDARSVLRESRAILAKVKGE